MTSTNSSTQREKDTSDSGSAPTQESAAPELWALWEQVLRNFDDEARHRAFLDICVAQKDLAFAARCYRQQLEQAQQRGDEQRALLISQQLERLTGLAWNLLQSSAKPPPQFRRAATWVAVLICMVFILAIAFALQN